MHGKGPLPPERPLRVCIAIPLYPPDFSGMGIQVERSLPFLKAQGIEVTVLTRRPAGGEVVPDGAERGAPDRVLHAGSTRAATFRRVLSFRRYFARRHGSFDLVHSLIPDWEFMANARYLKSLGLPLAFEMVLLDGDDPLATRRETLGGLKLWLLQGVDRWIGISGAFLPRVVAAGIPPERFRVLHPGVDVTIYRHHTPDERRAARIRLDLPPDGRIVVSAGTVMRRKGADRMLRAWARLRPRPGRDLLLLVGPATPEEGLPLEEREFAAEVRAAAAAPGLDGTVRIAGRSDRLYDYFGAADLFLFLSRHEGLPIVTAEAIASGLPCVVSPLDGIDEVVQEGRTGHIAPDADDAESVAALMSRLFDRPEERAALGANGRRLALEQFSFEARARTLAAIYRELVRPSGSGRHPGSGSGSG